MPYTLFCTYCHLHFSATRRDTLYCSPRCRYAARDQLRRSASLGFATGLASPQAPALASPQAPADPTLWPRFRAPIITLLHLASTTTGLGFADLIASLSAPLASPQSQPPADWSQSPEADLLRAQLLASHRALIPPGTPLSASHRAAIAADWADILASHQASPQAPADPSPPVALDPDPDRAV